MLLWVDLWVGLGLVAAVFGPVWDLVNPLRLLGDLVDRVSPEPPVAYPEPLGQWPAVAALAIFGWMELAWPGGSHPFDLALVVVVYVLVQFVGMALVGADVWLERAELFTAFSRLMARVSPFEWYVVSDRLCPADLHDPGEVVGCSACWRQAAPEERGIRWRGFTAGTWRELPLLPGGAPMIVVLLSIVLFDGFAETMRFTGRRAVDPSPLDIAPRHRPADPDDGRLRRAARGGVRRSSPPPSAGAVAASATPSPGTPRRSCRSSPSTSRPTTCSTSSPTGSSPGR